MPEADRDTISLSALLLAIANQSLVAECFAPAVKANLIIKLLHAIPFEGDDQKW